MKIVAVVPVGPLDSLGYQYFSHLTLGDMLERFDEIFVITNCSWQYAPKHTSGKMTFFKDTESCLTEQCNAEEFLQIAEKNVIRVKKMAEDCGADIIVLGDIVQYIDDENWKKFRSYCSRLLAEENPWGYKYRSLQIGGRSCIPDMRHPWVLNARHKDIQQIKFSTDSVLIRDKRIRCERGFFPNAPYFFNDIFPPVVCSKDFETKFDYYFRHIWEYYQTGQVRDWAEYDKNNYRKALAQKMDPEASLTEFGKKILDSFPENASFRQWDLSGMSACRRGLFNRLFGMFRRSRCP